MIWIWLTSVSRTIIHEIHVILSKHEHKIICPLNHPLNHLTIRLNNMTISPRCLLKISHRGGLCFTYHCSSWKVWLLQALRSSLLYNKLNNIETVWYMFRHIGPCFSSFCLFLGFGKSWVMVSPHWIVPRGNEEGHVGWIPDTKVG